jgi:phospholipid/cholesterol/gamma-HCH transport system substrate-binding protein
MAQRTLTELAAGAVVILVAGGFLVYAVAHSGRSTVEGYPLVAKFDHIDGLSVGSDVRIAGVKVGAVQATRVDPKSFLAVVNLSVRDGIALPKDSSAEVTSDGLLGGKFLSLAPGGDTTILKPGQEITITQGSVSLEQLLGKFIFSIGNKASTPSQPGAQAPAPASPAPASPAPGASLK